MSLLSVPLKTILLYHADLQNETLPVEYAYCNGQTLGPTQQDINSGGNYTVPDLRNKFLLGADNTLAAGTAGSSTNTAGGAPGPKGTGGENAHTLATSEIPAHGHTVTDPGHTHTMGENTAVVAFGSDVTLGHNVSGGGSANTSSKTTGITIANAGGGGSHENRPWHYGIVYIMKVKL